jgi:death-on-curing protein
MAMGMEYLTAERVIKVNKEVTSTSGDPFAVENQGNLEHLIEAIKYKYEGKKDAVLLKAAFMLDMLANKGHIFVEGNKRTAVTSTIAFLDLNGYVTDTSDQKAVMDFVLKVASGKASLREIATWLNGRVKKRV